MDSAISPWHHPKTRADRACDQCKNRKVRCDMAKPCLTCSTKGFVCTYNRVKKKRGPRPRRIADAHYRRSKSPTQPVGISDPDCVPTTMVETEPSQSTVRSVSPASVSPASGIKPPSSASPFRSTLSHAASSPMMPLRDAGSGTAADQIETSPAQSESAVPTLPIHSTTDSLGDFLAIPGYGQTLRTNIVDCWPQSINEESLLPWIDIYFRRIHPTIPILNRANLYRDMLHRKHHVDPQHGAMLLALCAFAMTQLVQMQERPFISPRLAQPQKLLEECVRMRATVDFGENPSIECILASFFLFACFFGSSQQKAARHRLREAVDLAHSLGLHRLESYEGLDTETRDQWLRTYLVLSVTERAYALQRCHSIDFRGRPSITARFTQTLFVPTVATEPTSHVIYQEQADALGMTSLLYLMETFDTIDENVMECWNGHCKYVDGTCDSFDRRRALEMFRAQYRVREASLTGNMTFAPSATPLRLTELPESQQADISITHFWLLNRLWNLCWSHGLLRESSDHNELRYAFAFEIAKALWVTCSNVDPSSAEVHGVGLVEKIFDVATGILLAMNSLPDLELDIASPPSFDMIPVSSQVGPMLTLRELLYAFDTYIRNFRGGDHPYASRFASALRERGLQIEPIVVSPNPLPGDGTEILVINYN